MGYYTYFSLSDNATAAKRREIALWMVDNLDEWAYERDNDSFREDLHTCLFSPYEYLFDDSMKWYEHCADMTKVANAFPDVVFVLQGIGEEFGDIWREYYCGEEYHESMVNMVFEAPDWAEDIVP